MRDAMRPVAQKTPPLASYSTLCQLSAPAPMIHLPPPLFITPSLLRAMQSKTFIRSLSHRPPLRPRLRPPPPLPPPPLRCRATPCLGVKGLEFSV